MLRDLENSLQEFLANQVLRFDEHAWAKEAEKYPSETLSGCAYLFGTQSWNKERDRFLKASHRLSKNPEQAMRETFGDGNLDPARTVQMTKSKLEILVCTV